MNQYVLLFRGINVGGKNLMSMAELREHVPTYIQSGNVVLSAEQLRIDTEQVSVNGNVCYLHAPDGIGRSKLAAGIEACLGVRATGRNLNTVDKLVTMLDTPC